MDNTGKLQELEIRVQYLEMLVNDGRNPHITIITKLDEIKRIFQEMEVWLEETYGR